MPEFKQPCTAAILGASGGIDRALVDRLVASGLFSRIYALTRSRAAKPDGAGVEVIRLDHYDEDGIEAALARIKTESGSLNLALAATGLLHHASLMPEKSLRQVNRAHLLSVLDANAVVPVLFAKHASGLMARTGPSVLAAISARVGSIGDNRLGGWYAYRSSKAALNMLYRTLSIECRRTNPNLIVTLLHPGTTDTPLSKPFQASVAAEQLFSPSTTAGYLFNVIQNLEHDDSGGFFAWDGAPIDW